MDKNHYIFRYSRIILVVICVNIQETALNLHQNSFVLDTHCDTLKCLTPMFTRARDSMWIDRSHIGLDYCSKVEHIDIPRLQDGGVNCQVFAIASSRERTPPFALKKFNKVEKGSVKYGGSYLAANSIYKASS